MKVLFSLSSVVVLASCRTDKPSASQVATSSTTASSASSVALDLSAPMRSALVQFAPTFEPFSPKEYTSDVLADSLGWQNSRPYEARGDFNGDGAIDVALNGHDKTRELLIVILSQPDGSYKLYALKAIARQPTYNHDVQVYLTAAKPGRVEGSTGAGPDSLPHGGIVVNYMPPTSEIYYWNGSDFLQFFTGD